MAKVLFKFGSRLAYEAELEAGAILDNALYFLEDTNELYKGVNPIGSAHYYFGTRNADESDSSAIARILGTKTAVLNDILVIEDANGAKNIYLFAIGADNKEAWQKITGAISSSNVVFADGNTLEQKMTNLTVSVDNTSIKQDVETGTLSIAGYGESYWRWDETEEGYVLQTVDATHPWKSGLTPRVYRNVQGNLVIGWYEPNPTTAEGVATDLTAVKQDIESLEELVGQEATSDNNPATGLVKRITDLESLTYWTGDVQIQPLNTKLTIPYFNGTIPGVVQPLVTNLSEKSKLYLSASGEWTKPYDPRIGSLTYKNRSYSTVEAYVDAALADVGIEWEEIANN